MQQPENTENYRPAPGSSAPGPARRRVARLVGLLAVASLTLALAPVALGADSIYWSNNDTPKGISKANLDGSGGGTTLNTSGASVTSPRGLAIDAAAGKV